MESISAFVYLLRCLRRGLKINQQIIADKSNASHALHPDYCSVKSSRGAFSMRATFIKKPWLMEDMISSRQLMSMSMACSSLCASSTHPIWSCQICLKQLLQGPLAPHCYQTVLLQVQEAVHSPGSHQPSGAEAKTSSLHVSYVQGNVGPSAPPIPSS